LTQAFQRGEEKGFTYFFNTLYPTLLYYAFQITKDQPGAKDIVEDSFIKIWERHATFTEPTVIKSWLYITVRNACIDWLRRQKSSFQMEEELAHLQKNNAESYAMQEMIRAEVTAEIYRAITDLPPRCQQVFKLIYIEGKTIKQTAQEMQLSVQTIKNHRTFGLKQLKKHGAEFLPLLVLLFLQL